MEIHSYSIHDNLKLKIISRDKNALRFLHSKLSFFFIPHIVNNPDIELFIGRFDAPKDIDYLLDNQYHVGKDVIYWRGSRKMASWNVVVRELDSDVTNIRFHGNRFSYNYLYMHILEAIIHYKLCCKGYAFLHASCVSNGTNAYLFPALHGTGKTSVMLYLLTAGMDGFLSDEFTIISSEGVAYSYPAPALLYWYNLEKLPHLKKKLSFKQRLMILTNYIIYKSSLGYSKPGSPIPITDIFHGVTIKDKAPLHSIHILTRTANEVPKIKQYENKHELIQKLILINKFEFRFTFDWARAYSYVNSDTGIISQWDVLENNLRMVLDKVPCYEIEIPSNFDFTGGQLLQLMKSEGVIIQ